MQITGIAIVALAILAFALVSKRLDGSWLTMPMAFVTVGWLLGPSALNWFSPHISHGAVHTIAELTLVLVLFSDASRIDAKRLVDEHTLPLRMLAIGMPLTIALGAIVAWAVFPGASFAAAILVAAILASTDAALGQTVVTNPAVPTKIQQALSTESGLNDGIALPVVLVFAIWAGASASGTSAENGLVQFAILQVTLGPLVGVVVGYAGGRAIDTDVTRNWVTEPFQGIAILATAILAFASAESLGGNGFIAAFAGGLAFGATVRHRCKFLYEFMESEGQLLTMLTFLIFGAVMIPAAVHHMTWQTVLLSLLFLTIVRMLPVALSLSGLGVSLADKLFLGWFGPRGLASILFALLIVEKYPVPGAQEILACVVLTVLLSIFLHGMSAAVLANAYGTLKPRKTAGSPGSSPDGTKPTDTR